MGSVQYDYVVLYYSTVGRTIIKHTYTVYTVRILGYCDVTMRDEIAITLARVRPCHGHRHHDGSFPFYSMLDQIVILPCAMAIEFVIQYSGFISSVLQSREFCLQLLQSRDTSS
jgi:hypothetical protein